MRLRTQRLELIPCDEDLLRILISDKSAFEKLLNIKIPEKFTDYGLAPLRYAMEKLTDPTESGWWTYLPVQMETNLLIGTCGYKGKPDHQGMVEIAYEVINPLRQKGFGREIASSLIMNAFNNPFVKIVRAHTSPDENPSVKILKSCNLKFTDIHFDPEEGKVWRWEINAEEYKI
jgi:RimJ/RimL family protein N-acetyltransferase